MKKGVWISLLVFFSLTITSFSLAYLFNTGAGEVVVRTITIEDASADISGIVYVPNPDKLSGVELLESSDYAFPAVILVHGVMNAKEAMSSLALELSRAGIVALTIDALGHGNSEGVTRNEDDPSLGGLTALNYVRGLPFVNQSQIGVIGHSMGVGAIRAISTADGNIKAHIFIGGVGSNSTGSVYGELNINSPGNLLVAIGKYDELFDLESTKEFLQPVFGTTEEIELNRLYGNFTNNTARKLITPNTIHLFEPISHVILKESVAWMGTTFELQNEDKLLLAPYRDLFLFIGMISLLGMSFPVIKLIMQLPILNTKEERGANLHKFSLLKMEGTWSFLHLVLFAPPILVLGMSAVIFPLSLGTTTITWVLLLAISGVIMVLIATKRKNQDETIKHSLKKIVDQFTNWKGLLITLGLFLIILGLVALVEMMSLSMKMFVPLYSNFTIQRFWMFLILLPFIFVYFTFDGIIVTGTFNSLRKDESSRTEIGAISKVVGVKILPFVLVLMIQYLPLFAFEFKILTGFLGFSMQFIIMLVPLFIVFTLVEILFYKITKDILPGAFFNSLLLSWTLAILLSIASIS
ncbi:MAG: alpha/beta hydrolase [Candidatus Heimdallarchaeota archaeon]|nr:alpha/beta hydrolase [Candidatus Heimdallarchaeota archaeon]